MIRYLKIIGMLFAQSISAQIAYRWWLVQFLLGESVYAIGTIFYWKTAGETARSGSLYSTSATIITYFVLVTMHVLIEEVKINQDLSLAIRSGRLSASMIRPIHPLLTYLTQAVAVFTVRLATLIPISALIFVSFGPLREIIATKIEDFGLLYLAALILLFVMSLALRLILGLLAFGMTQTWGPELVFMSAFAISGGTMFPLDLLPSFWFDVFSWTPTFYLGGFPALVLMGHLNAAQLATLFMRGAVVFVLCAFLASYMWKRGVRKYEAVGI